MNAAAMKAIREIAKEMGIETLETRGRDSLDFHDLAVWTVKDALEKAYAAGAQAKIEAELNRKPDAEEKVFKGYTEAELKAAFEKVCHPDDWKAPIVKRVPTNKMDVTIAAIEFYTATEVKVTALAGRDDVTIESIGYRAGPAGDH